MSSQNTMRILAKYSGKCICGQKIVVGEPITYSKSAKRVIECPFCERKRRAKTVPKLGVKWEHNIYVATTVNVPEEVVKRSKPDRIYHEEDYTIPEIHDD